MSDVTHILSQIESGDPNAAEQLLPLVYEELRKLAAAKLAFEKPGQTLQATALVHEAFLRLVASPKNHADKTASHWDGMGAKSLGIRPFLLSRRICLPDMRLLLSIDLLEPAFKPNTAPHYRSTTSPSLFLNEGWLLIVGESTMRRLDGTEEWQREVAG